MNVPFTAVQFVVYESGKRALVASHLLDSTDEEARVLCVQAHALRSRCACRFGRASLTRLPRLVTCFCGIVLTRLCHMLRHRG
jgi:hypothetical protein